MKFSILRALLFFALAIAAQPLFAQTGFSPGGRQGGKMGKMYGKVVDAKTGKPVGIASVSLLKTEDGKQVLAQGGITQDNGEFSLEGLPLAQQYELVITALGYKDLHRQVAFDLGALMKAGAAMKNMQGSSGDDAAPPAAATAALDIINKDLGNIALEPSSQKLEGVTVTASQPSFMLQGEKKVFNVDQNLSSQGGTAADVMKNVPGVLVDADNNVSIRNSAPLLLVDGRQSPLTLDQIPADAIESVEVITNPSAKYDAEGGPGGVLNIVLKKNRKMGYNGSVRAGADSRGGGNLGGNFNARSGKFNLSFNGHASLRSGTEESTTDRYEHYSGNALQLHQDGESNRGGSFMFGKLGLDFFATNRTTLSVGLLKMHGERRPDESLSMATDTLYGGDIVHTGWASRNTGGNSTFDMNGLEFGIKHLFPRAGETWSLDASARGGKNSGESDYTTAYFNAPGESAQTRSSIERNRSEGSNNFYTLQSDYSRPFANKDKLDLGVKATIRTVESRISNAIQDSSGAFIEMPFSRSNYRSDDQVYAAYASYSGNIGQHNSYQIGLRAESSNYDGELLDSAQKFTVSYPVSLFPSVAYTHTFSGDQQLQFSYRRGIRRPSFFQLLPYVDYSDPLNIRQGNPALGPEFTNAVELSYMKNFTRSNYVLFTLYERHSDNLITNIQSLGKNLAGDTAIVSTPVNAGKSDKYGAELTVGWDLAKWWNATANANLYNGQLSASNGAASSNYFSGFGKLNNQFRFSKGWSAQLSAVYQSRTNLLADDGGGGHGFGPQTSSTTQGYLDAQWFADASLRKSFLKNDAASLTLSVNDIFGTRKFVQHTESDFFVQDYSRISNPQMIRLSFNWRFGKADTDLFRRKNLKGQMDSMQDVPMGM